MPAFFFQVYRGPKGIFVNGSPIHDEMRYHVHNCPPSSLIHVQMLAESEKSRCAHVLKENVAAVDGIRTYH